GFNGIEQFSYTVADGLGGFATGNVTIEVSSVNQDSTANSDGFTIPEDSATVSFDVLQNDSTAPDVGETITITAVGPANHGGAVSIVGGFISYKPAPNFTGIETFPYTIIDGSGGQAVGTVSVNVTNLNDNPTVTDDVFFIEPDTNPTDLDVLAND